MSVIYFTSVILQCFNTPYVCHKHTSRQTHSYTYTQASTKWLSPQGQTKFSEIYLCSNQQDHAHTHSHSYKSPCDSLKRMCEMYVPKLWYQYFLQAYIHTHRICSRVKYMTAVIHRNQTLSNTQMQPILLIHTNTI